MAKYILKPFYGDMSVKVLGSGVSSITKAFKKHWNDILEFPEEYDKRKVNKVKKFFEQKFKSSEEIAKYYNKHFDEDRKMEETY